jgi:ABC-2 type transport system permease protein
MLGASVYIIVCTARNRMRQRLRRLREPRYLIGAVAGLAYLTFTLFIRQRVYAVPDGRRRPGAGVAAASGLGLLGPVTGGVLLGCAALVSWILPFGSGLLTFSKAETAFLFPSPVNRRQLVIYRLMRSQFAVFTGALIMALAYPTVSPFGRLRGLVGVWVVLMTSHVFFTGVTLARARLGHRDGSLRFAWPALALSIGAVLSVLAPLLMQARRAPLETATEVGEAGMAIARHGVASVLLWPFTALVRPLFAQSPGEFALALIGAAAVYVVSVLWLLWADALSLDTADASTERQVNRQERKARAYVARPVAWRLGSSGRPEVAFIWKSVLQTFRVVDRRVMVRILLALGLMVGASLFMTRTRGLVALVGVGATWGALFTVFMAPQIIRMDLRQDLAHLELLKTWPVRGTAVVRGEILWPAIVVTAATWAFGLLAMVLSMVSVSRIPAPNRAAAWLSFLMLVPGVVLAQYTIHNAVAVLFPGWVPLGASRPRGVDAVGQRLILLAATWLVLLVALVPGVAVTAVMAVLLRPLVGPFILPVGTLVTTLTVVGEMLLVTNALGPVYDRLDVTSTERAD